VRQIPVTGLQLWTGRGSTGNLSAFWVDLDDARDFMTQRLDYRRTVRLVLDELELSFGPVGAEATDSKQSSWEIQSVADLVQDVSICSVGRLNLTDNKVGVLGVLECHIPRLELHVKAAWQIPDPSIRPAQK
jgi:hypothetical protein